MKNLLIKEIRLVSHPTTWLFMMLGAMLLIPNYPYDVTFFYMALGIFFTCLNGRENHDVFYTMTLPVRKRDIVRARFAYALIVEAVQVIIAAGFTLLRGALGMPGNMAGMDANTAFFGFGFALIGLFNFAFFTRYYASPDKVGRAFALSSVLMFVFIFAETCCVFAVPFVRDVLDTPDPLHMGAKCAWLGGGFVVFVLLTAAAYRRSVRSFEALDL